MATATLRIVVVIAVLMGACTDSEDSELDEIRLGEEDAGNLVELQEGQIVEISLEGNPSTGFEWEIVALDENVLALESQSFKPESDLDGAPGLFVLRFAAAGTGTTDLELAYRRPWEEGVEPLASFSLRVVVR
jgi:inhibitor of cysteine peptidase